MPPTCYACQRQQTATEALSARGARLTELRRDVLQTLHHSDRPLGAYDLFDRLKHRGRASAPPAVYRVLDFLVAQGLVHKLHSLGTYTACTCSPRAHQAIFYICEGCGTVEEDSEAGSWAGLTASADARQFRVDHLTIEAVGRCRDCARP